MYNFFTEPIKILISYFFKKTYIFKLLFLLVTLCQRVLCLSYFTYNVACFVFQTPVCDSSLELRENQSISHFSFILTLNISKHLATFR